MDFCVAVGAFTKERKPAIDIGHDSCTVLQHQNGIVVQKMHISKQYSNFTINLHTVRWIKEDKIKMSAFLSKSLKSLLPICLNNLHLLLIAQFLGILSDAFDGLPIGIGKAGGTGTPA